MRVQQSCHLTSRGHVLSGVLTPLCVHRQMWRGLINTEVTCYEITWHSLVYAQTVPKGHVNKQTNYVVPFGVLIPPTNHHITYMHPIPIHDIVCSSTQPTHAPPP